MSLGRACGRERLAKPVFDVDGKLLLNSGVELNERYRERLIEHGVTEVYVRTWHPGVAAEDAVSDASRIETTGCAHACLLAAQDKQALPAGRVTEAVEGVCDDLRRSRGATVAVSPARSLRDWWEVHARNVTLLCAATAQALGLGWAEASHVGAGGLLHDIGLIGLTAEPLCSLQQQTEGAGRGHPVVGFQTLIMDEQVSANSAVVCLQHHERWDGSGFPRGLQGDQISLAAQICAVADVYDHLIAPPPFGDGILPHLALQQLRAPGNIASAPVVDAGSGLHAERPPDGRHPGVALGRGVRGHGGPTGRPERFPQAPVLEANEGGRDRLGIARGDGDAVHAVENDLREASRATGHDRAPAGERLDGGESQGLVPRGNHDHVGGDDPVDDLLGAHRPHEPQRRVHRIDRRPQLAVADEHAGPPRACGEGSSEDVGTLASRQPPEVEGDQRPGGEPEPITL